jgi:phytanoyl-CoA hydroxylase
VRNPAYFGGDESAPKLIFDGDTTASVPWEGKLPGPDGIAEDPAALKAAGFIPVPCEAGDALVFPGTLDHLSLANSSTKRRHTFQLHLIDGVNKWSEKNWLQYPDGKPFMEL